MFRIFEKVLGSTDLYDFAPLGYLAMNAREFLQTDVVMVAIVLYAILGKLADILARQLESVWLRWHPAYQKKQGDAA